jgi:hypothetical protein
LKEQKRAGEDCGRVDDDQPTAFFVARHSDSW